MGFNPGGSGGIANASDVALSNPQNNHVLTYDSTSAKWENAAGPGGRNQADGYLGLDANGQADTAQLPENIGFIYYTNGDDSDLAAALAEVPTGFSGVVAVKIAQ